MLVACKGSAAILFIRVPDATEGDIQKAVDIGALGIIIPMVDTVEKAEAAVQFAKYPSIGRRSQGGRQSDALWGTDYRQTANANIMIMALIENPAGAAIADKIAAVPGIGMIFVASADLASFTGLAQGNPGYEAHVTRIFDAAKRAGLKVGGPFAWKASRTGYDFFMAGGEAAMIRAGATQLYGVQGAPAAGGQ